MRSIEESVAVVKQWVEEQEPGRFKLLFMRSATPKKFERLESILGQGRLPTDFRALYQLHDGAEPFRLAVWHQGMYSLKEIGACWSMLRTLLDCGDIPGLEERNNLVSDPRILPVWWSPGWIPFTHDFGGNLHCYDLTPGGEGGAGQIIRFWHDTGDRQIIAPSLQAYMDQYAVDLLQGLYALTPEGVCSNQTFVA